MARREQRVSGREAMIRFEFRRLCGASGGKVAQNDSLERKGGRVKQETGLVASPCMYTRKEITKELSE